MHIVTGGAGFIGSNLVQALVNRGHDDVVVVDDLEDGHKFVNISDLPIADYLDKDDFIKRLSSDAAFAKGIKAIFHQGACSATTEWDGRFMMKNNYAYSQDVLHHCLEHKTPYIYASSAAVYGGSKTFVEDPLFENPLNIYGYSKLQFDRYVRRVVATPESQVVGLRYFNVYGPRQDPDGDYAAVIPKFAAAIRAGEAPCIFGDGEQTRDFVMVDDVVEANLLAADAAVGVGAVCNVASGTRTCLNALLELIREHTGARVEARYDPPREGDVRHSVASLDRAREVLGYAPRVELREGLRRTLDGSAGKGDPA